MNLKYILVFFFLSGSQIINAQSSSFVSARNHQFYLNDIPQYYIGTNYWYGELLALEKDKSKGIDR
ncbi:MAG: beta-mannosidase, partial [Bacteroidota bacterium]|nr:beta-mannosidase [Bacteroidota bacterium]